MMYRKRKHRKRKQKGGSKLKIAKKAAIKLAPYALMAYDSWAKRQKKKQGKEWWQKGGRFSGTWMTSNTGKGRHFYKDTGIFGLATYLAEKYLQ